MTHAKLNNQQREENFSETLPPLSKREAVVEATRCLFCYDAPCTHACPTHIDIPSFIKKISTDNMRGAARVILDSNFLGSTCARVCPVQELCEGACVLGSDHKPIEIGRLQRHATDHVVNNKIDLFKAGKATGKKIAVIGSGPAGLSCAAELAKLGHAVTIFEKKEMAGGLSTYGIVVLREPIEVSLNEVEMVRRLGVTIKTNTAVTETMAQELLKEYDALFFAVGLGNVPALNILGENLAGVHDGIEFIEASKTQDITKINIGNNVCVVGAGNTAIDAATIAKRLGAEHVSMIYRRGPENMSAYTHEYEFAKNENIEYRFFTTPIAINGATKIESIRCTKMQLDQNKNATPIPNSEHDIPCDQLILAIGQEKQPNILAALGAETKNGYVLVNQNNQSKNPKVFAGGDCIRITGSASTVMAVQDGKIAANGIHEMLVE